MLRVFDRSEAFDEEVDERTDFRRHMALMGVDCPHRTRGGNGVESFQHPCELILS